MIGFTTLEAIAPRTAIEAGHPLVQAGGPGNGQIGLREDVYDAALAVTPKGWNAFDIFLSGGEPYSVWY